MKNKQKCKEKHVLHIATILNLKKQKTKKCFFDNVIYFILFLKRLKLWMKWNMPCSYRTNHSTIGDGKQLIL